MRTLLALPALLPLVLGIVRPVAPSDRGPATKTETPTFMRDIQPIIRQKCVTCHTRGGSAPFPLETYEQVRKRGDLIQRMVLTRSMPPITGTSDFGTFNELGGHTTDEEGVLLQRWLQAGGPRGEGEPVSPVARPEWRLGEPDAVLRPRASVVVDVEGRPYWKAFVLPLGEHEGKRLRGFDVRVTQPLVARNATLGIAREGLVNAQRGVAGYRTGGSLGVDARTLIGTWAPGYLPWALPEGVAMTLDGRALVVHVLYQPRGKQEDGGFELALYFERGRSAKEATWVTLGDESFAVPAPGALTIEPRGALPPRTHVLGVIPEGRFYCTYIGVEVEGRRLFGSLRWEPYWTGAFRFAEPVAFPEGAELRAKFQFDNDIHMGRNEGTRPRPIRSGIRERDEVARVHLLTVQGWEPPAGRSAR